MSAYFFYPFAAPTIGITLPNPEFGNTSTTDIQVSVRHSRNGDRYAYRRTPSYETLKLDFKGIKESLVADIKFFFKMSAASEVKFIDHKGTKWKGIITSNCELVNDGRDGCGDIFNMSVTFEGEQVQ